MKRALIYSLVLFACAYTAAARVNLPMPTQYVEDKAGIISADYLHRLNALLKELEQKTGVQFIILTVGTTGGVPIERYSIELVEQWKLGQAEKDNGLLFTIAYNDRSYRFEVGYGLEAILTDQYCGRIGRDILTPEMRQGRTSRGIYQSALAMTNTIAAHHGVQISGIPEGYRDPAAANRRGLDCCSVAFMLLMLLVFLTVMGRGSFLWPLWLLLGMQYGASRNPYNRHQRGYWGYGRGGFGGFGGFGGRGGGFGGGLGGGFGGGGFSGRW